MYFNSMITIGILIGGSITILLILQLIQAGTRWIKDEENPWEPINKWVALIVKNVNPSNIGIGFFMMYIAGLGFTLAWGIGLPGIIIIGILFGLRGFIRLKKKVNKVLNPSENKEGDTI